MKAGKKIFYLFLTFNFTFFITPHAGAETTACNYMYYNQSPRVMGMGSLDAVFEDFPSANSNPALLAFSDGGSLSLGGGDDAQEAGISKLDTVVRFGKAGIGFGFFSYSNGFDFITGAGESGGSFSQGGNILSFSAGYPVHKNFALGAGLRSVEDRFEFSGSSYKDSTIYADMGGVFKYNKFRAALHLVNFGGAQIWTDEELPSYGRISLGYAGRTLKLGFSGGSDQVSEYTRLGAEYSPYEWFAVRFGMESTDEIKRPIWGIQCSRR